MKLVLIRGIPGSGKSTFAHDKFPGILLLENDMFHMRDGRYAWKADAMPDAIRWCYRMAENAMKCGMDVVVANTLTRKAFVKSYADLAKAYGAKLEVYRMTGDYGDVHNVPADVKQNMTDCFEDWEGEIKV